MDESIPRGYESAFDLSPEEQERLDHETAELLAEVRKENDIEMAPELDAENVPSELMRFRLK